MTTRGKGVVDILWTGTWLVICHVFTPKWKCCATGVVYSFDCNKMKDVMCDKHANNFAHIMAGRCGQLRSEYAGMAGG